MRSSRTVAATAQSRYYGSLFDEHGAGVDAVASGNLIYKDLRYRMLADVFGADQEFSVHDVGFGLAHFHAFLKRELPNRRIAYSGSEVTEQFVQYCRERYSGIKFDHRDIADGPFNDRYDYLIFGGTFYHLVDVSPAEFQEYAFSLIENAFAMCHRGVAFNLITEHVEYRRDDLFYCNMIDLLNFITTRLSRFFTIHHNYPLYEYTVCVFREPYVASNYSDPEFAKYLPTLRDSTKSRL